MIINHTHKFCFYAIPRTGSKAISKVLIEQFGSEEILRMHSGYKEFASQATKEELRYFSFATVRHPMDSVVSAYFKKKSDHNGRFSRGTFGNGRPIGARALEEYQFISENKADFATYFLHFYKDAYRTPRHDKTLENVAAVLRFEHLENDLNKVLSRLKLPSISLPVYNTTKGRSVDFRTYYTPDTHERAQLVFGPMMERWNYEFPF